MATRFDDSLVRTAVFEWPVGQVAAHGDVLPREVLAKGFELNGVRLPLLGPQGIFKPQALQDIPLSIATAPNGPYDDAFGRDGFLRCRYRGTNPSHPENRGLREAMLRRVPLVYFHGVVPGRYVAAWPVYIVADDPSSLAFSAAVDDAGHIALFSDLAAAPSSVAEESADIRRAYVTAAVRVRLHQRAFRERVLEAYQHQCAFCRFRHVELLDAAHIVPDSHPEGAPVVRNGLALCTLHHAAFGRAFLGVRPDYVIEVRPDILRERDGPTLRHAVQELHGSRIALPRAVSLRPDPELLKVRYEQFTSGV